MKLQTVDKIKDKSKYLRLVCYGEPGTGKTWFGASACLSPSTSPVLFVNYRSQIGSLRSKPEYMEKIESGDLIIVDLESYSDLTDVYSWLYAGRKGGESSRLYLDKVMAKLGHPDDLMPKTVVIDSVTELQRSEVIRTQNTFSMGKLLVEITKPKINDWGSLLNQFSTLAHFMFQLPYHVVFIGLETVDYGDREIGQAPEVVAHRLALQGDAKRQFPAYAYTLMRLDHAPKGAIFKSSSGGKFPVFNIGSTKSVKSKTKEQTGFIPDEIANPTLPKLAKMLEVRDAN